MEGSQIPNANDQPVTVAAFSAKFRSKREIYQFLTLDVRAYLPAVHTLTIYFLKDIVSGAKKRKYQAANNPTMADIQMRSVVHISCPAYENLSLEQVLLFFNSFPPVDEYLPVLSALRKVPKAWVCNIGASVIGAPFFEWVNQRINERNANVIQEKNLAIAMDPQVAKAFHESTAVSRKYYDNSETFVILSTIATLIIVEANEGLRWSAMTFCDSLTSLLV